MRATTAEVMAKAHKMREDCLIEEEEDQYLKENPYGQTAEGMREKRLSQHARGAGTARRQRSSFGVFC